MTGRQYFFLIFLVIVLAQVPMMGQGHGTQETSSVISERARQYLNTTMDAYHNSFDVYTDLGSGGNHFPAKAKFTNGSFSCVNMDECHTITPFQGATCIRCTFDSQGNTWGGFYFLNGVLSGSETEPQANWGDEPNAGFNLTGATQITFYARGENGGERVEFIVGGVGWLVDYNGNSIEPEKPYAESFPKIRTGVITLGRDWQQYQISLQGMDLSYVLSGFGWVVTAASNNNNDVVFFLDHIRWNKTKPGQIRLLNSYVTSTSQADDFDVVMRNTAFSYDNALALLYYLVEDPVRARIVADSFFYAIYHDRYYPEPWLRNAYMSGQLKIFPGWIPNNRSDTVRMPGFWNCEDNIWLEDSFQVSSHTGNLAWVMIGLISAYQVLGDSRYLDGAKDLGEWVETNCYDNRGSGGYTGGFEGWEPSPAKLLYKSTEHNIDLYVAFQRLYYITAEAKWRQRALHAKGFVLSMWDGDEGLFYTGTTPDGITINKDVIPLDTQTWTLLAFRDEQPLYLRSLDYVETHHKVGNGYDFNTDQDGIWYEGTGQMAVAYHCIGQKTKAETIITAIESAQLADGSIPAASFDGLTTGFFLSPPLNSEWVYFHRGHIGATAWYLFAQRGINPYWIEERAKHPDFNQDNNIDILWRYDFANGGWNMTWLMNGLTYSAAVTLPRIPDLNWYIAGTGDFNNDSKTDILWRYDGDNGGWNMVWLMNGTTQTASVILPRLADLNWQIKGTGDFNHDGTTDILWRYEGANGGWNMVWFMNGTTKIGSEYLPRLADLNWQIEGTGDFNRDGNTDILWRYYGPNGGWNMVWLMNGTIKTGSASISRIPDLDWKIGGTGDFDRDGNTDILWRYYGPKGGWNMVWLMNGTNKTACVNLKRVPDINWKIVN